MPQTQGLGAVRLCWCQALPAFPTEQRVLPAQFLTEGWPRRLPGASQCRSWVGESDCEALVESAGPWQARSKGRWQQTTAVTGSSGA